MNRLGFLLATGLCGIAGSALGQDVFIAGLAPSVRPAGAPVITEMHKDAAWYARALTGVTEPFPASLRFLEDQGAWFTPFTHPGMPAPYDIRGWHSGDGPTPGRTGQ